MNAPPYARIAVVLSVLGTGACTLNWKPRHDPDAGEGTLDAGEGTDAGVASDSSSDGASAEAAAPPGDAGAGEDAGADAAADDAGDAGGDVAVSQEALLLWLRADRGVTSSEGRVASWADQSTNHADTGQLTADYRPILVSPPDGVPGVVFDGVDDFLAAPAGFQDFSTGVTMVAVASIRPATLAVPIFEASNGSEVDDVHLGKFDGGLLFEVATEFANPGPIDGDAVQLLVATLTPTLDVVERRNGMPLGTSKFGSLPSPVRRNEVFVGRSLYREVTTFPGVIHELLVYARALSDAELLTLEQGLAQRWRCCGL
jgi:hypothetical protein